MKKYLLIGLVVNVIFVLVTAYTYWSVSRALHKPMETVFIEEGVEKIRKATGPQINDVAMQLFRDLNSVYTNYRGMAFCALSAICIVTVFNTVLFVALLVQERGKAEKSKG